MTYFEMDYRKCQPKPQRHQLSIDFEITAEQVFETLEIADINIKTTGSPKMVEPIVNSNVGNNFHHQNVPHP